MVLEPRARLGAETGLQGGRATAMSSTQRGSSIQDRTRAAIVEAAAVAFGRTGASAKLDDVAEAAGVSRATVYRYFSSRDELLEALVDEAYQEVVQRVRDANIEDVPFIEALARVTRAAALTADHFVFLHNDALPRYQHHLDDEYESRMIELFRRGQNEGLLRQDVPTIWLRTVFRAIVTEALYHGIDVQLSAEDIAPLVVSQFMHGASAAAVAD
jgi:TetR/AcrR family transcriptional regulator, mexCD-oprJ operon repressor